LRFDYRGTGDSWGTPEEATVEGWLADIRTAVERLGAAETSRLATFGLALGGTLAALATCDGLEVRHLLLWDPIVDGSAYLSGLATAHRDYMVDEMGAAYVDRLPLDGEWPREALGMPITRGLAEGIRGIDLTAVDVRAEHITVVTTKPLNAEERAWRDRLPDTARWLEMTTSVPWNSDAALNDAVVPMDVVTALLDRVVEVSP
jgi:pimeloyl-ACP methyl ester carboxylesterase